MRGSSRLNPLCKVPTYCLLDFFLFPHLHLPPPPTLTFMAPVQRKCNAQGQYEIAFNTTEEGSIVGKVVREEYKEFVERLKARLKHSLQLIWQILRCQTTKTTSV